MLHINLDFTRPCGLSENYILMAVLHERPYLKGEGQPLVLIYIHIITLDTRISSKYIECFEKSTFMDFAI